MILGYKSPPNEQPYYFGKVAGHDKKFVRVIAGLVLPAVDRQVGALVVLAELFRSFGPMDLTALEARVGPWPVIQNGLTQLRRDLKFDHIITENEHAREILWRVPALQTGEIPIINYAAPSYSTTEIGRQKVDALVDEGKLHLELIESRLDREPEQGLKALSCVVCYAQEFKAYYAPTREREVKYERIWGVDGL